MPLRKSAVAAITAVSVTGLGGCAVNPSTGGLTIDPTVQSKVSHFFNDPNPCSDNSLHTGAVLGGLAGGLVGYLKHGGKGAVVGAVAGATVGGLIGHALDNRRCKLYKIAKANHLKLMSRKITSETVGAKSGSSKTEDLGLDVQLQNQANEFVPGTAKLTHESRHYLADIAKLYTPAEIKKSLPKNATTAQRKAALNRKILIVGHTDERDNVSGISLARLSEERAKAVAEVFAENGVPRHNINYQGAGDMLPLASNATSQGRQHNNRVQIVDVPSDSDLKKYVEHRRANPANFMVASSSGARNPAPTHDHHSEAHKATAHQPHEASGATKPVHRNATRKPHTDELKVTHHHHRHHRTKTANAAHYGFDGTPLNKDYTINLGAAPSHGAFSLISSANADTPVVVNSCLGDHPHESTNIKNLATGHNLKVSNAIPGLYGQPWMGSQGHSSIALMHVYAPRDAASPVPPVTVEFYRNKNGKVSKRPLHVQNNAPVNVYRGDQATLYRVFVKGPAQCIDLYVPNRSKTGHGLVVYPNGGKEYKTTGTYKSLG